MLHFETLTDKSTVLFPKLASFKNDFYLAGGTALALQIGHRVSVDFDLFSPHPIKKMLLSKVEADLGDTTPEVLVNRPTELTLIVNGVKCTFLEYPFPTLLPLTESESINLLSPKEILATKAYTIGRRGSFKDYADLYVGIRSGVSSLKEICTLALEKYREVFNDRLFLEQLLYLDDVEELDLELKTEPPLTKAVLVEFFSQEIKKLEI